MGQSYSVDLRERVVSGVDGGLSRRASAEKFGVSASFAVKLVARREATGDIGPVRQGRPPGSGKLAAYLDDVMARVDAGADITMPELAGELEAAHGLRVHPSFLSRALRRAGYSYKKNAQGLGVRTRRYPVETMGLDPSPPTPHAA